MSERVSGHGLAAPKRLEAPWEKAVFGAVCQDEKAHSEAAFPQEAGGQKNKKE
jgi:hypothetical protein